MLKHTFKKFFFNYVKVGYVMLVWVPVDSRIGHLVPGAGVTGGC